MLCFLCRKKDFTVVYSLKTKNILRCRNDGLILGHAAASSFSNIYQKDYYNNPPHPPKSNHSYFLKKLETIRLLILRQSSGQIQNFKPEILDIGCGWGDFEEVLEKEKIPYLGIDTNKEAIKICREKGLNCQRLTIKQLFRTGGGGGKVGGTSEVTLREADLRSEGKSLTGEKGSRVTESTFLKSERLREGKSRRNLNQLKFDAITMFQVIEHLNNPLPLLKTAKKLLKKNGVILITTPNNDSPLRKLLGARWSVYNEPSHFIFYNKKTLKQTMELAGFKNIQVKLDQMRFLSSNYILKRLKQMHFPTFNFSLLTFNFPIPTDPFGDLEATAFMNYD